MKVLYLSRFCLHAVIPLLLFAQDGVAQITLDGSMGESGSLEGSQVLIDQSYGQTRGENVFHSFSEFNVQDGQSATFLSENNIENIVARVSGNNHSFINGRISAEANLYLINPNGILFGSNASLDVNGSFFGSTADYLGFDDDQRFYADLGRDSVLSLDSPSTFGFLDSDAKPVEMDNSYFDLRDNESVHFVGGDITMLSTHIGAEQGDITLQTNKTGGEVAIAEVKEEASGESGTLRMLGSQILSYGASTGNIYIRSGAIVMEESTSDGVRLDAQGSLIINANIASAQPGSVNVRAETLDMRGFSTIGSAGLEGGDGGDVLVNVDDIDVKYGGFGVVTLAGGEAGDLNIDAQDISFNGRDSFFSGVTGQAIDAKLVLESGIAAEGASGDIFIQTSSLKLENGAVIDSVSTNDQRAGDIEIKAEEIHINGRYASMLESESGNLLARPTGIIGNTRAGGHGGNITLNVNRLYMAESASLSVTSTGLSDSAGNAGGIQVFATDLVDIRRSSSISSESVRASGGDIKITAGEFIHIHESDIKTSVHTSTGDGGNIELQSNILILNKSNVFATAFSGDGGDIQASTNYFLFSPTSQIDASSSRGIGGEVIFTSPEFDLQENIVSVDIGFLDIDQWNSRPCAERDGDRRNHIFVDLREGASISPYDMLSIPILPASADFKSYNLNQEKSDFVSAQSWTERSYLIDCSAPS